MHENNSQKTVKLSLNELRDNLNQYANLNNDPDYFINNYFASLRNQIDLSREEQKYIIDEYYDGLIAEIDLCEIDCRTSLAEKQLVIEDELMRLENQFDKWNIKISKVNNEATYQRINNDVNLLMNDLELKIQQLKLTLLKNKSYEFKQPCSYFRNQDLFGRISVENNLKNKKYNIISSNDHGEIEIWDPDTGSIVKKLANEHYDEIFCTKLLSDRILVSCSADETIKLWKLDTWECFKTFETKGETACYLMKVNPKEFISGHEKGAIKLWNIDSESPVKSSFSNTYNICGLELLPSRGQFLTFCLTGIIEIWDLNSFECTRTIDTYKNHVYTLKRIPDTDQLMVCTTRGKILKRNLDGGGFVELCQTSDRNITALELITQNKIAIASDNLIRIWNIKTNTLLKTLKGHHKCVVSLKLIKNNRLVSGSQDNMVKIWDLKTFTCLRTLSGESTKIITSLEFLGKKIIRVLVIE